MAAANWNATIRTAERTARHAGVRIVVARKEPEESFGTSTNKSNAGYVRGYATAREREVQRP